MNAERSMEEVNDQPTVRIAIGPALCRIDDELQTLKSENGTLRRDREQLRIALGLAREEIIRQKASHVGLEKRLTIAETMVGELLQQLETTSPTGRR
jgi:hypothetical protein